MSIKKFKKKETNRKKIIKILSAFMIVGIILSGISYAVYQKEEEKTFINAKVGDFKVYLSNITSTSTNTTIDLSYTASGLNPTTTCKYGTSSGSYTNIAGMNLSKCNITGLTPGTTYYYQVCVSNNGGQSCKTGSIKTKPFSDLVNVGDYISMTPTSTSYTMPGSLTGYTGSTQTINPSELNLWRVIRKNSDGTVDVVSEYVSSTAVTFRGQTGYMNLVGVLNTVAAQYTNSAYVQSTRHMGYRNQIEYCSSLSETLCPTDAGYTTDTALIQVAVGTLENEPMTGTNHGYWLPTRHITGS